MRYGERAVLEDITVEFAPGHFTAIVGPNGAGKSTLLSIMAGLRQNFLGECFYKNREVRRWKRKDFAREVALVQQSVRVDFPFTAEQVVLMGRTPFGDGLFESPADRAAVERAMQLTECEEFRSRDFRSLSGGERQRVILASALAQEPRALLADEPATFLDLKHQVALYRLLRELARQGMLVVAVTHDLNLAAAYGDRLVVLQRGKLAADSTPEQVLNAGCLRSVFEVEAAIRTGECGRPQVFHGD
jgi:iron complex transport system ATP-binding protein